MDILSNYRALLASLGMSANDKGIVTTQTLEGPLPTTVNGLQLILPVPDALRDPDWTTTVAFHPLSEQINAGESLVQRTLCLWINARLTTTLRVLAEEIALLAADTDRHKTLNIRQAKILKSIPTLNAVTVTRMINIFNRATLDGEYRLINLYQARGKELNGTVYPRVTFIEFPILTRILAVKNGETDDKDVFGISGLTKNDINSLIGLFEILVGEDPTVFSAGSHDSNAPFFHSLISTYWNMAIHFNTLIDLLGNVIEDSSDLAINMEWSELVSDLGLFIGKIPPLEHNRGDRKAPPATARHSLMASVAQTNLRVNAEPVSAPTAPQPASVRTQVVEIDEEADASTVPASKTSNWGATLKKLRTPVTAVTRPEDVRGQPRVGAPGNGRVIGYDAQGYPVYEQPVEQPRVVGRMANGEPIYDRPPAGAVAGGYPQQQTGYPTRGGYPQQPYYNQQQQPGRMSRRQMENTRR